MVYEYDFGDSWEHTILLEDNTEGKLPYPVAISGKGTWLDLDEYQTWDPNAFDLKQCNENLSQYLELDEEF